MSHVMSYVMSCMNVMYLEGMYVYVCICINMYVIIYYIYMYLLITLLSPWVGFVKNVLLCRDQTRSFVCLRTWSVCVEHDVEMMI